MSRVYHESEHQELFYPAVDLRRPAAVHIPSAMARLGYFVCVRTLDGWAERLDKTGLHMRIGGQFPDDVTLKYGEGVTEAPRIPSSKAGLTWTVLCRALVSRGDGTLTLLNAPADLPAVDLLLTTWRRCLTSGFADDWLACQADPQWTPGGVPLGGLGTGKVEICRDGRFRNFSGNNNQDLPFEEPDGLAGAFLSLECGGKAVALASRGAGGLPPCGALRFEPAFPQAVLRASNVFDGLDVSVRFAGPLRPHRIEDSCLPGFVMRWTITSRRLQPANVLCRMAWPNLVGRGGGLGKPESELGYGDGTYRAWDAPEGQTAESLPGEGFIALRYGNIPNPTSPAADGFHYAAAAGGNAHVHADPLRGHIAREVVVAPGGSARVDMAVAWEMPHWTDSLGVDRGMAWRKRCGGGMEVLSRLFEDEEAILAEGDALRELLARSDLPAWVKDRLTNCNYPLVTNSVLYPDGRFSINEGPGEMAGCYGTLDQRLGAHPATQLLFPELNRRELEQFAAIQAGNGGVSHDLGKGHLERPPTDRSWPDLTCSFILQAARHAWSTGDSAFEERVWPRVRRALLRHALWAEEGGGVAQVGTDGMGTSYDGYHYVGTTPYMATLWLAALRTARAWAKRRGDGELLPRIERWMTAARERMDSDLWNGRYYRAYGSANGPVNDNCHAGALAGEWYARMLAGEDVLPEERLSACSEAFFDLVARPQFRVPPDEVAPDGSSGSEFGWLPYVECFGLAPQAARGDARFWEVWRRILSAYDQDGRTPCDTRLMYRPGDGQPSWGAYYMTAPASWLVYEAWLDFVYRPAERTLRLAPKSDGRFPVIHPLFWGMAARCGGRISLTVERVFGEAHMEAAVLEAPRPARLLVKGKECPRTGGVERYDRFAIAPFLVQRGAVLEWETVPAGE